MCLSTLQKFDELFSRTLKVRTPFHFCKYPRWRSHYWKDYYIHIYVILNIGLFYMSLRGKSSVAESVLSVPCVFRYTWTHDIFISIFTRQWSLPGNILEVPRVYTYLPIQLPTYFSTYLNIYLPIYLRIGCVYKVHHEIPENLSNAQLCQVRAARFFRINHESSFPSGCRRRLHRRIESVGAFSLPSILSPRTSCRPIPDRCSRWSRSTIALPISPEDPKGWNFLCVYIYI